MDPVCERARCLASLRLDGETTEFEEAFLESHLTACGVCRAHAAAVGASTDALRAAPVLEAYEVPSVTRVRRLLPLRHVQLAAAAVVLVAAGLTGLSGVARVDDRSGGEVTRTTRPAYYDSASYELQFIRELATERPTIRGGALQTRAS